MNMRNILSYQLGTIFLGQEINDWLDDQIYNHRSHYDEAERLHRHYRMGISSGFIANEKYEIAKILFHTRGPYQLGFFTNTKLKI